MTKFDFADTDYFNITLSGPKSPYSYTSSAVFTDSKTITIKIDMKSQMRGNKEDLYEFSFDTNMFLSEEGVNLSNKTVSGSLRRVSIAPEYVDDISRIVNIVIYVSLFLIIGSKLILGGSGEIMWAFINTMQIIYFFPALNLGFPDHLSQFLIGLTSTKVRFPYFSVESFLESEMMRKLFDMPANTERWENMGYPSTSVIINGSDYITLLLQVLFLMVVVFAIRAYVISAHFEGYEESLEEDEKFRQRQAARNKPIS